MPFRFQRLAIPDVILIQPRVFADQRGFFTETYRHSDFAANGIACDFVQDNLSRSVKGVLRGLHYQRPPRAQAKLVMVVRGEVFDVAVDIRRGSPTFGRWIGITLSDTFPQMIYIPVGFAHGFCVLSAEADFAYKVTADYAPELDTGILWNDPAIGVKWPISDPLLSPKDLQLPTLAETSADFFYDVTGSRAS